MKKDIKVGDILVYMHDKDRPSDSHYEVVEVSAKGATLQPTFGNPRHIHCGFLTYRSFWKNLRKLNTEEVALHRLTR